MKDEYISNKFKDEKQYGKKYEFKIEDGKIVINDGINYMNFVVINDIENNNFQLILGNGHAFLADGQDVLAAGSIKINSQGYIRQINNLSGHYRPEIKQAINYPDIFKKLNLKIDNAYLQIYKFESSKSKYITNKKIVCNSPIKYCNKEKIKEKIIDI